MRFRLLADRETVRRWEGTGVLTDLRVRDLGVIEDLTLAFGPGMTALTGETGAGKTLVVEALQLVLGGRANPGMVRGGRDRGVGRGALRRGRRGDGDADGDGDGAEREVILARSVPAEGRSKAWVDGRMAPVGALGEAAPEMVEIHGQHEHRALVTPAAQRNVLDAFAGTDLRAGPRPASRAASALDDGRWPRSGGDEQQRAREADVLRYQVARDRGRAPGGPRRGGGPAPRGGPAGRRGGLPGGRASARRSCSTRPAATGARSGRWVRAVVGA